jgi:hypothetical protein
VLFVGAIVTAAAAAGGAGFWAMRRPAADPSARDLPVAAAASAKPSRAVTPEPLQPTPAAPPAPAPEPTPLTPGPGATPTPIPPATAGAVAPRKVKLVITSEPAGADVCLAKDHVLLGRTKLEWSADRGMHPAKLLLRKRGYRGQEIAVGTDRDGRKQVTLSKLGPDDIDDIDNCERR